MWLDIAPSILKGSLNYSAALTCQKNPLPAHRLPSFSLFGAGRARALAGGLLPALAVISNNKNVYQYLHRACVASRIIIINNFPLCEPLFSPAGKEQPVHANASHSLFRRNSPHFIWYLNGNERSHCLWMLLQSFSDAFTTGNMHAIFSQPLLCCVYFFSLASS